MSTSLIAACLWALLACGLAMFPSKRNHWPAAYGLMVLACPILVAVIWQHNIWMAVAVLVAMLSILRWPVIYTIRWLKTQFASTN